MKNTNLSEAKFCVLVKESSIPFNRFFVDCSSIKKYGCLLLNMRRSSVPIQGYKNDVAFWSKFSKSLLQQRIPESSSNFTSTLPYIDFVQSLFVVVFLLSGRVPLLGCGPQHLLRMLVLVGSQLLRVGRSVWISTTNLD